MPPVAPKPPLPPEPKTNQDKKLTDIIAQSYLGYESYDALNYEQKIQVRQFLSDFLTVVRDPDKVLDNIQNDNLTIAQQRALDLLVADTGNTNTFIQQYVYTINGNVSGDASKLSGYRIEYLTEAYRQYKNQLGKTTSEQEPYDLLSEKIAQMGKFKPYFDFLDTEKQLRNVMLRPGKFREDTGPAATLPYQCRVGGSTFFIPPTSISVHQGFKAGSITGGVLRQPNSAKMNLGHSETSITLTLYFPNHETIWGFNGDTGNELDIFNWDPQPVVRKDLAGIADQMQVVKTPVSDEIIDSYLASLRGLITQFKYSPILPIKNEYLNRTFDIDAVALIGMTVSTLPDFPFALVVNLELAKYNYTPLMPMISNFDQAIHWGKFRQYMGRAASRLDSKVNQGFLITKPEYQVTGGKPPEIGTQKLNAIYEGDLIPRFDKVKDIVDGRNFDFYYPISDPARIFAPDTTDFRQPGEDQVVTKDDWDFVLNKIGLDLVDAPQFNFFEYDKAIRNSKYRNEMKVLQQWLNANKILWQYMSSDKMDQFIADQIKKSGGIVNSSNSNEITSQYRFIWGLSLFKALIENDPSLKAIQESRLNYANYTIKEWKVPMEKLYIDWSHCIVQGVSVSLSNNFAKLQVQLHDEPTYQHIGGGDSTVQVSMVVIGEDNLLRIRRMFDHINGLARIEQAHGVLGFLGIKNVVTALCGIKYVLPLDLEVDTLPNFPHVYSVQMSFIDFDVMQQERESLSSEQQKELVDHFSKRNPFLRLKQAWGAFNAYPDFPLDIRDENGKVVGHLDPDWYFRAFNTTNDDKDIFTWDFDPNVLKLIQGISRLRESLLHGSDLEDEKKMENQLNELQKQLEEAIKNGAKVPSYWQVVDGKLERVANDPKANQPLPEPEMTIYLGSYSDDKSEATILSFFEGGYVAVGTENVRTKVRDYSTGMSFIKEDLASENLATHRSSPDLTPLAEWQREYLDGVETPNQQYQSVMLDYAYRNVRGRMLRAFPTYMLWLIDEGGRFAGIKLFDNFYGINSVIDFSVSQSEKPLEDTLILRLSNIYHKLTTPYREQIITEDDPLYGTPIGQWIATSQDRERNLRSGLTDEIIELNNIRLKPGVRIHLRMGYSANPNALQTVFNGVITEVEPGDIVTVIAQSDAVEFSGIVNTVNPKGSSGKLDGGLTTGFWMSEPRDLIVRLLTMGSSNFKEWFAWGSKGVFFSDSRFGIRHFGSMLYEPMHSDETKGTATMLSLVGGSMQRAANIGTPSFGSILGAGSSYVGAAASLAQGAASGISSVLDSNLLKIGQLLWINSFAKRDYEIFKRNVYPGNGTGIAQFMGGDQIDGGIIVTSAISYFEKKDDAKLNVVKGTLDRGVVTKISKDQQTVLDNAADRNEAASEAIRSALDNADGVTDQEVLDTILQANLNSTKLDSISDQLKRDGFGSEGILEQLLDPFVGTAKGLYTLLDTTNDFVDDLLGYVPGFNNAAMRFAAKAVLPGGKVLNGFSFYRGLIGGVARLTSAGNPLGHLVGLSAYTPDDDLAGFDEVSFRAQTYMKSVWDLFEVCAALLPNYIIAVRPFEDRSTLFYGKPHWLYTSGVVPVTLGVPKNQNVRPMIEEADKALQEIINRARGLTSNDSSKLMSVVDQADGLKDIMNAVQNKAFDPNQVAGDTIIGLNLSTPADLQRAIDAASKDENFSNAVEAFKLLTPTDYSSVPPDALIKILNETKVYNNRDNSAVQTQYQAILDNIAKYIQEHNNDSTLTGSEIFGLTGSTNPRVQLNPKGQSITDFISSISSPETQKSVQQLIDNDPITFAYQFGWKFSSVPVWINPETGNGIDKVGDMARKLYDSNYEKLVANQENATSIALSNKRSNNEANDIWETIRNKGDGIDDQSREIYNQLLPLEEQQAKYDAVWELFLRFMWQDPYNRAWAIVTPDKTGDGILDTAVRNSPAGIFTDNSNHWNFSRLMEAWRQFIMAGDIKVDEQTALVTSQKTRQYLVNNVVAGKDSHNFLGGVVEDVKQWWDNNIGQLIGVISDTITGFVASIRASLAQIGNALSMTGTFQAQANILNAALNDSIYYRLGTDRNDILRLVDNPFTREYGEPVVEIREPFQRLHFISSFDNILSNGIKENLEGVATVVTATSDGKHPVTVHFDKGVPPDRQVEKTVETGLLWDNAIGQGLFGFLQPLLHPLESLRSVAKIATGAADELSARRVALYHLKESLKGIYGGEVIIIGDADIRPFDLVYMADVYERMYGMFEAQQVIHHFTPETGFVTAITPNPIVTINDPVRYSLLSYMTSKMANYNLRDDMRAWLGVTTDRAIASATKELDSEDIYKSMSTQINGSIQYTHGSTAIIRDVGAVFAGGGVKALTARDEAINNAAKIDLALGVATAGAEIGGAIAGTVAGGGPGAGTIIGGVAGWAVSDLVWKGWQWVKDNLLDQHGCYIQYLNKDGQPMDAGLAYYQGVAAGTNHTIKLLPAAFGLNTGRVNYREDGHFRITTNDLLTSLGWTEYETTSLVRETSMFVNNINSQILKIAGRDPVSVPNEHFVTIKARILDPLGETVNGKQYDTGITDGDTIKVQVLDGGGTFQNGEVIKIRFSVVNAYELKYKNNDVGNNPANDLGYMAYQYLASKFANATSRTVAIRFDKRNMRTYDRYVGVIFHNVPLSVPLSDRLNTLANYASQYPPIPFDDYLPDGRPYTLNWEMVMTGFGNVDMRESLWDTTWRNGSTDINTYKSTN